MAKKATNKYNVEEVSVRLNNYFFVKAADSKIPLWAIRRVNEGVASGAGADYPVRKLAVNYRTYYSS